MPTLVLLRHGQSQWNLEDRFTGWVDVGLTPAGEAEATRGGELIAAAGIEFDRVFASVLNRAILTADLALAAAGQLWIPMEKDWRLNERHYGGLTGLNKAETAARLGPEQVHAWRRSYDIAPPPLAPGSEYDLSHDRRYAGVQVPATETLKSTLERVQPYWDARIAPALRGGERLLIGAHGNSLRAIVKLLFQVPDAAIPGVEIPTGNPLLIELDQALKPVTSRYLDERRAQALPARGVTGEADQRHMRRAIELARARLGRTGDNPAVGCVIVRDGEVVAEAATAETGRPHAEEQALAAAGAGGRGATAFVTMEPCGERSNATASCAERLIAAGVARVVFACGNPHGLSAGRGPARLRDAGIAVESGLLAEAAATLYQGR